MLTVTSNINARLQCRHLFHLVSCVNFSFSVCLRHDTNVGQKGALYKPKDSLVRNWRGFRVLAYLKTHDTETINKTGFYFESQFDVILCHFWHRLGVELAQRCVWRRSLRFYIVECSLKNPDWHYFILIEWIKWQLKIVFDPCLKITMTSEKQIAVDFTWNNHEIVRSTYHDDNQYRGYKGVYEATLQR